MSELPIPERMRREVRVGAMSNDRIALLEAMLTASEEHTAFWEARALAYEAALKRIAEHVLVTETISKPFPIWVGDREVRGIYTRTLAPFEVARHALEKAA